MVSSTLSAESIVNLLVVVVYIETKSIIFLNLLTCAILSHMVNGRAQRSPASGMDSAAAPMGDCLVTTNYPISHIHTIFVQQMAILSVPFSDIQIIFKLP